MCSKSPSRRRTRRRRLGATAVEFALVAPLLFLFVFGLFEFGRLMMVKQKLNHGAELGARTACLATTQGVAQVDAAVRQFLGSTIRAASDANLLKVTVAPAALAGASTGDPIQVDLEVALSTVSWVPTGPLRHLGGTTIAAHAVQDRE